MRASRQFEKILIIWNPASTNAKRLKKRTEELQNLFPKPTVITTIETSPKGREANRELLLNHKGELGPGTLLCIAAGDGTVNLAIETLLADNTLTPKMRQTLVLPLWGGNANDLAHMLNGYSSRAKLRHLFKRGRIITVNPLRVTLTHNRKKTIRIAACYASFGATAYAAHRINKPSHRQSRFRGVPIIRVFLEIYTVIRAFRDVPTFKINENGNTTKIYEYALINGSRIAKLERMPIRLTDNEFLVGKIIRKHPVAALYILQLLRRRKVGHITSNRQEFTLLQPTWLQLDGEVVELPADTKVEVELNGRPFYALSKRLR